MDRREFIRGLFVTAGVTAVAAPVMEAMIDEVLAAAPIIKTEPGSLAEMQWLPEGYTFQDLIFKTIQAHKIQIEENILAKNPLYERLCSRKFVEDSVKKLEKRLAEKDKKVYMKKFGEELGSKIYKYDCVKREVQVYDNDAYEEL